MVNNIRHTNAGGEKVLWSLTNFLIKLGEFEVVVYCDVIESKEKMIEKVNVSPLKLISEVLRP